MNTSYQNRLIEELRDQQVRFAPREKKLEQIRRAEKRWRNSIAGGSTPTNTSATASPTTGRN
jgi:hypothetical protein